MPINEQPWYQINEVDQIDSPALVVYADRVKANINTLINSIDDVSRLRPHVKTHKSIEVTKLLLAAGIHKFKCATIAEAEMLGMCKAEDVLLAYQPCRPKLERFIALQKKYPATKFSCLVDNHVIAGEISELAKQNGITIYVFIDLNVGMNRTGIEPENAIQLCEAIANLPNIKLVGLHAYDGHIDEIDMIKRTEECTEIYNRVIKLKKENMVVVMGGSPSFPIYSQLKDVECSPGTFVYWDENYLKGLPEQNFLPAILVVGRIISMPSSTIITVDIGHKAISSEYELSKRIRLLNTKDLKPISHSEEHLVLEAPENHAYKIGDVVYGLPFHVCPTCALYDYAISIEGHTISETWKTIARNRVITI